MSAGWETKRRTKLMVFTMDMSYLLFFTNVPINDVDSLFGATIVFGSPTSTGGHSSEFFLLYEGLVS